MAGRKVKCKETGRIAEIVIPPERNNGETLLRYEDGSEVCVMPFELEAKYEGYLASHKNVSNPFKR